MKKSLILLGTLPLALLAATFMFNAPSSEVGAYESRSSSNLHHSPIAEGMLDYYHKLRGDYTQEDYLRVKAEADAMPKDRATVTWNEQGPDNIGGRTRAILVDKNDINHIFCGSVSGGLFESVNRANFWAPVPEWDANNAISSMCQTLDGTIYIATGHQQETSSGSQNAYDTGANGDGLYKRESDGTFTHIATTENFAWINEVRCAPNSNEVWFATNSGLRKYDPIADAITTITNGLSAGACQALDISYDGNIIVAGMTGGKTLVSKDGGVTFLDMSSSANSTSPINAGAGRMEYSISKEMNTSGQFNIFAVGGNSFLTGVWMSQNNGDTWTQTAPANNQQPGSFAPFSSGGNGQAAYDMIITSVKGNPNKMILGGIDTYSWSTTGNWTQLSQWFLPQQSPQYVHADNHEMIWDDWGRLYIGNDGGVQFSDDGGQTFHPANRGLNITQFYAIGHSAHGDVIGGTQDNGSLANYHDNSTWHEFDEVGGGDGFSAEISFINRNILFSSIYYSAVFRSADRGGNTNAFMPTEFATVGNNSLGCAPGATDGSGCGQFFTNFRLWENPNDLNSTDSVSFVPGQAYLAGETVIIPSKTTGTNISYVTPTNVIYQDTVNFNPAITGTDTIITSIAPSNNYNLTVFPWSFQSGAPAVSAGDSIYLITLDTTVVVSSVSTIPHYYATNPLSPGDTVDMGNEPVVYGIAWDTLKVQDPYQSWFAIGLGDGNGVWLTRNALRMSAPSNEWFKVNHSGLGGVSSMEFSRDGNHLFIGTWSGQLWRLSNIGDIYSPKKGVDTLMDVNTVTNIANLQTTWTQIGGFGAPVTGIGVFRNDVEHVTVSLGNFSGADKVRESLSAATTTLNNSFVPADGNLPSGLPVYGIVMVDANNWVVGTDLGTYTTEDGGSTWVNSSGGIGNTPVFDMKINWRTYDEGCLRPGEIYAGTHGRGIWSSEAFLSLPGSQDNLAPSKYVPNILIYPNPLNDQGTLVYSLESSSNVTVQIFNLSGQLVREINQSNVAAGENKLTFGAAELPKGTYIVRLTAGNKVETSKFVKH